MNKDKAIQLLERLQDPEPYEPMLTKDAYDAIQMAIDALSANGDTISRKAAVDRATKEHDFFRGAVTVSDKARRDELLNVMCWLGELQPAQLAPDQNGDLWITVPDIDKVTCIYVQESKSKFCRIFYEEQPERIIHCKDCEWWTKQECSPQGRCALSGMYPTGGWFCGNAKRREVTA